MSLHKQGKQKERVRAAKLFLAASVGYRASMIGKRMHEGLLLLAMFANFNGGRVQSMSMCNAFSY